MSDSRTKVPETELTTDQIDPRYNSAVTTQSYGKAPRIHDIKLIELRHLVDDGGSFAELLRLGENGFAEQLPEFAVRQVSFSVVQPGIVKAFHLHYKQDDLWFVPPNERMLVGLLDARADSPTSGVTQRIVLGAGRAQLLYIPKGVAHGVVNQLTTAGVVFYFVTRQFQIDDPDEHRLPHDLLGASFWQMTPG